MRLFRVFIRAQSEFLFRCYSHPRLAPGHHQTALPQIAGIELLHRIRKGTARKAGLHLQSGTPSLQA